jgi:flagellar motility protein MotE (MotC chaperone)
VIVTRQRKRRRHLLRRFGLPLLALAALAFALTWPPSQHAISSGPLKPAWDAGANALAVVGRPLSFASARQEIVERNRTIRSLNGQLDKQRQAKSDDDTRIQQLQQQIATLSSGPKPTPIPAPVRTAAPAGAFPAAAAGGSAAPATEAEKRLAATWAAMEPERAAAVIQRLPDDEVTRVLGAMEPDSAGEIMNALPPAVAARISRASAQVSATSGR